MYYTLHGASVPSVQWYNTLQCDVFFLCFSVDIKTNKTSQELRMLSSVAINCQVAKIVINPGSQLSVL